MALAHQSIATISAPEFINLQPMDINPLMSSCEIKVLYIGANRNKSYITKQVAAEMAKTLRGAPIVGYYKSEKEDFADHGQQMIWDDTGIHFNTLTKPYGFVAPDAKVWFQDFDDINEADNSIITRTYLMTTGYLWTEQFKEASAVIEEGRPQSMQLDENSLNGQWSKDIQSNMEFFIINDAIFSKLCILGDDVEPCFEGSGVTAPQVSASFTLDDDFKRTLFSMMKELKEALEGGKQVANVDKNAPETEETTVLETEFTAENQDNVNESSSMDNIVNPGEPTESTFAKKEEEDEKEDDTENKEDDTDNEEEDDDDKKKYAALKETYNMLQTEFNELKNEIAALREFKATIEDQQKDVLINEFYMLSDEDKADVITNKAKYTLEEIESKLAVICFKKKVNFNLDHSDKNEDSTEETGSTVFTFDVNSTEDSTPDWVKAVESTMNNN